MIMRYEKPVTASNDMLLLCKIPVERLGCLLAAGLLCSCLEANTEAAAQTWLQNPWTGETRLVPVAAPDFSLWDESQVVDYQAALGEKYAPPLAVLTIDELGIEVPVFNGTEERVLDRGAGRIKGMARPDEAGNLGIAAHRDSFFRGLKDIRTGVEVLLRSPGAVEKYRVTNIRIVAKDDISVLAPTDDKRLTLVTCYPFYFEGSAPQRYIVTAEAVGPAQ